MNRCAWAKEATPSEQLYHDQEWGKPCYDDRLLFEAIVLELMQAGLSWSTIIKKRTTLSRAFAHWDYLQVAQFTEEDVTRLLQDSGVIRHRKKIEAVITNAQALIRIQQQYGSFATYLWSFVAHQPQLNHVSTSQDVPRQTPLSKQISQELKAKGFAFLGPVTVYSLMQAVGLVNDHEDCCEAK